MNRAKQQAAFLNRVGSVKQIIGLFDLLTDVSFFIKDRRSRLVALNRKGCEYRGVRDEGEAFGKTDHDFFSARRADTYTASDKAVMDSGEPMVNRVECAPEVEGSPRLVMTSKIPLRDARGRIIGLAGFSREINRVRERPGMVTRFAQVVELMHNSCGQKITTHELATRAGLSPSQFNRRFHQAFSMSPAQYILRVRIERACKLLAETDGTISVIAVECGFHDHAHLGRFFHRVMGMTPSCYRRGHQMPSVRVRTAV